MAGRADTLIGVSHLLSDKVICRGFGSRRRHPWSRDFIRIVTWNIERGLRFSAILDFLRSAEADVLLLQEVDLGVRRTQNRDIACELAHSLELNYIFGREFQELGAGSGDSPAFHGLATLSPWPLLNGRIIRFRHQSNFWRPRWYIPNVVGFQRRLGTRIALFSEAWIGCRRLATYNLHLESRGGGSLRFQQLRETLDDATKIANSSLTIVGGDFNMNLGNEDASAILHNAGFHDAVRLPHLLTTRAWWPLKRRHAIDWIYVSRQIRSEGQMHATVRASDHFPVSATFLLADRQRG